MDNVYKRFQLPKLDLNQLDTDSLDSNRRLVNIEDFVKPLALQEGIPIDHIIPNLQKGRELRAIAQAVNNAVKQDEPVIMALGAHVIKCGLSPIIIDLLRRRIITTIACTGAFVIHDLEIAMWGATSEDVDTSLAVGQFGMSKEPALAMHAALRRYVTEDNGIGFAVGGFLLDEGEMFPFRQHSVLAAAAASFTPLTVHVTIGADVTHMHRCTDGALLGKGSLNDFRLFASVVSKLSYDGCFFNIGSAVTLPEVFLKAVSLTRNLGYPVHGFTTVNMDQLQHHRPLENVVRRPTETGGKGYTLTGHHEIMLPVLFEMIMRRTTPQGLRESRLDTDLIDTPIPKPDPTGTRPRY